jgi:hypothetical protein
MDPARDAQFMKNTIRFLVVALGTIVSLVAFVAVIQRWHAFNANTKFEAIVFLFVLATYPTYEIMTKNRKQEGLGRFYGLIFGYILILLAVMVFSAG